MAPRPSKIVCVGRNYRAHAQELGNDVPDVPLLFFKPPSAIIGPGETILLPSMSRQVEHEAEIAVIIGVRAHRVAEADARGVIGGIACLNDVTARDLQRTDGQWARAKGFDTFAPLGEPVAPEAAPPLEDLEVFGRVNGETRQHGYARDMIFPIGFLIAWISRIFTLEPGDVLATGTPAGVGPLAPGDTVTVEIPGVGTLANPVAAASD